MTNDFPELTGDKQKGTQMKGTIELGYNRPESSVVYRAIITDAQLGWPDVVKAMTERGLKTHLVVKWKWIVRPTGNSVYIPRLRRPNAYRQQRA